MASHSGWVYQIKEIGSGSARHEEPLPCFMVISGRSISIFLNDPAESKNEKPVRRALAGANQGVEDLGRQKFSPQTVLHVFRVFNKQEPSKAGLLGCTTAEAAQQWISALQHAQEEAEKEVKHSRSSLDLKRDSGSHRGAHVPDFHNPLPGFHRLLSIGKGVFRDKSAHVLMAAITGGDAMETADWRIFHVANGLRFFEDVSASLDNPTSAVVKAVGVVEAPADAIFELLMTTDLAVRSQWDPLTAQTTTVEVIDGHNDIVHSYIDAKYLKQWQHDRDVVYSRYWRIDQDGAYSITQFATTHPKVPVTPNVVRVDSSPGSWEIMPLPALPGVLRRCLVRHTLELSTSGWAKWRPSYFADFEDTVPYTALNRIAGMKEYFAARICFSAPAELVNTPPTAPTAVPPGFLEGSAPSSPIIKPRDPFAASPSPTTPRSPPLRSEGEPPEEFHDCSTEEDDGLATPSTFEVMAARHLEQTKSAMVSQGQVGDFGELDSRAKPVSLDPALFSGTLPMQRGSKDNSCWSDPGGENFVVRGESYLHDKVKVSAGDPLLKLVAVDWFKADIRVDHVAARSGSLAQSDAGKKVPFLLVLNLQVPGKPKYNMVFYFAADRPIRQKSLLDQFANGSDNFQNNRMKLIPRIVKGYWLVKRAVGTKACLLGKALATNYFRKDNYLEIDCDIGSSSVANGIIGVVIGYVTTLVIDMAIVIQGESEKELPEYLLGAMRVQRLRLEDAKQPPPAM